jgi:uncharacterized delta-60 repeat protein
VAIQADGKFVETGWSTGSASSNDFALARFNEDGTLDQAFGTGGVVNTDFLHNTADIPNAVAIAPDGRIVAAGFTNLSDVPGEAFALARYVGAFSPQAAIQQLIADVNALVNARALDADEGEDLAATLNKALRLLDRGDAGKAVKALNDFSRQVNDLVNDGRLTLVSGPGVD